MSEHKHEWWYQPPIKNHRLFTSREERCDYWHCTVAQRSQAGFPDYVVLGEGWLAFVELKARSKATNRAGKVSPAQLRYKQSIETAGAEWVSFLLPDEWHDVDVWLNAKTDKGIWGAWKL